MDASNSIINSIVTGGGADGQGERFRPLEHIHLSNKEGTSEKRIGPSNGEQLMKTHVGPSGNELADSNDPSGHLETGWTRMIRLSQTKQERKESLLINGFILLK